MRSIYISLISIIVVLSLCISASAATIDGVYTYYQFTVAGSEYQNFVVRTYPLSARPPSTIGLYGELYTSSNNKYTYSYGGLKDNKPSALWNTIGDPEYSNIVAISAWGPGFSGSMTQVGVLFQSADIPVSDDYISAEFKVQTILPKDYEIDKDDFTLKIGDENDQEFVEVTPDVIDVVLKTVPTSNGSLSYYSFTLKYYFSVYSSSNSDLDFAQLYYPCRHSTTQIDTAYNITLSSFDDLILTSISASDYEEIQKGQESFEPIINIYTQQTPEDLEQIEEGKQQADKLAGEMDKFNEANEKLDEILSDAPSDPTELIEDPEIFEDDNFNESASLITNSIWDDAILTPMFTIVNALGIISYILFGQKDQ